ncbi:MAG: glycosyltransferase family 4 protein [Spirochaetales bacterium]|nr:glycosyltransferase family 4 protein [Spirochaetales bacterium]
MKDKFRVGIICGKLGGVDGVSLEVEKWIQILTGLGHEIFTIAGKYVAPLPLIPKENQFCHMRIRFDSQEQQAYEKLVFPYISPSHIPINSNKRKKIIEELTIKGEEVAHEIYRFIKENSIDVIIAENTNAMPMTLLGALAVYHLSVTQRVATIFHHHDFWWERSRFSHNHIETLLNKIMPPADLGVEHIVISSYAARILQSIKRVQPKIIPNCEDFTNPPVMDDYNGNFRSDLGFKDGDILIVQPTRIVRRKRIEDAVELVSRLQHQFPSLEKKVHFIISLYQGDEQDDSYEEEIKQLAERKNVRLHLIADRVASRRSLNDKRERIYTNRDVLINADFITYLPLWEGFGNALLEAIAAKIPVAVNTYLVYKTDIKVTGVRNVEIRDQYDDKGRLIIPDSAVDRMNYLLMHPEEKKRIVEKNFKICKKEFGFETLKDKIADMIDEYKNEILASRIRLKKSKFNFSV